jgi:phosphoglycerol geranylgeranyltransferase
MQRVLDRLEMAQSGRERLFALLIDPDRTSGPELERVIERAAEAGTDLFYVGGSLMMDDNLVRTVRTIKRLTDVPVVLFPGDQMQVTSEADAILLLSVISGRNPEMLIGRHVMAAPRLKSSGLEVIPTGYMLIDSGRPTTASYMSGTLPIPHDKPDIAACTALAGEQLGLRLIFMDGGSGAQNSVSSDMIGSVRQQLSVPLVIGGGIRTPEAVREKFEAGADVVVVGNAIEKNPALLAEMVLASKA